MEMSKLLPSSLPPTLFYQYNFQSILYNSQSLHTFLSSKFAGCDIDVLVKIIVNDYIIN